MMMTKQLRKIDLMHHLFGDCPSHTCGECSNFISGEYHDKTLRKCKVYGLSHSEATDWAKRWMACGMFNSEYNGTDIIDRKKAGEFEQKKVMDSIEGQMDMFGDEE